MNEQALQQAVMAQAADAGRSTDTVLAHLTLGEIVIPREIVEDPEVSQILASVFEAYGVDIREFTVGDQMNKINPETGHPEFFFKKIRNIFKRIAPIALPILGSMIPGIGTVAGAALGGAAGGAISGGGIKGALTGAALGGLGASVLGGGSGLIGKAAGAPLSSVTGNALMQGPTQGTGLLGAITRGLGGGSATGGLGNVSGLIRPAASIFSGLRQESDQEKMEQQLLAAQGRAESAMQPYSEIGLDAQRRLSGELAEGFNPTDLQNDPGYQYRVSEGQKALERSLAAQGMSGSGQALRSAQELGQGLGAQQYDTAYNQWLQRNQQLGGLGTQGLQAAGAQADIYGNMGNIQANRTLESGNILSRTLGNLVGGRLIGYDQNMRPIYA